MALSLVGCGPPEEPQEEEVAVMKKVLSAGPHCDVYVGATYVNGSPKYFAVAESTAQRACSIEALD